LILKEKNLEKLYTGKGVMRRQKLSTGKKELKFKGLIKWEDYKTYEIARKIVPILKEYYKYGNKKER